MWIQMRLSRIVFEGMTLQQGDVGVWARSSRPCLHGYFNAFRSWNSWCALALSSTSSIVERTVLHAIPYFRAFKCLHILSLTASSLAEKHINGREAGRFGK